MLERLGEIIRGKGQNGQMPETFAASPDMMSVLGCGEEDLAQVLRGLGFREARVKNEAGEETTQWQQRPRREERRHKPRPQRTEAARPPRRAAVTAAPYGTPATEPAPPKEERVPQREERQAPRPEHKARGKDRKPRRDDDKDRPRERRPEKPFVVDPDSPFAALAALKFRK